MRIAFISFEAPPDSLLGGIGTYVGQAARTLANRGHDVEVITASPIGNGPMRQDGYLNQRVQCPLTFEGRLAFRDLAGRLFAERHAKMPFDVLEGPEFLAEAAPAKKLVPDLPLVVKLHMSMTLIRRINQTPMTPFRRARRLARQALQPVLRLRRWQEFDFAGLELPHLLEADEISAPCAGIADITAEMWRLDRSQMAEVPYPFAPPPELLAIPAETNTRTVGFVGRLEQRKGVTDLAEAVPAILRRFPDTRFFFAGKTEKSPRNGVTMQAYLEEALAPFKDRVAFLGPMPHSEMSAIFRKMDIAVLPSLWENFPNACLEAMAAARGVVGSSAGGMAQQLDGGRAGLLVRPGRPSEIAQSICRLLEDPEQRMDFGRRARARVLSEYSPDRVGPMMELSYARAIEQRRAGGRRWRTR